jgi:hypothetical protein
MPGLEFTNPESIEIARNVWIPGRAKGRNPGNDEREC